MVISQGEARARGGARQVWLLAWLGLAGGAISLTVLGIMLGRVRSAREDIDHTRVELAAVVAQSEIHLGAGRPGPALADVDEALLRLRRSDDHHFGACALRASALEALGRIDEAEAFARAALERAQEAQVQPYIIQKLGDFVLP